MLDRMLMELIFTEESLMRCSLSGKYTINREPKPGLCQKAVETLLGTKENYLLIPL